MVDNSHDPDPRDPRDRPEPGTPDASPTRSDGAPVFLDGVREVEHTADTGIEVEAPSLPALFHRAARGMLALTRGGSGAVEVPPATSNVAGPGPDEPPAFRDLTLDAPDVELLLVKWLQEIHHLESMEELAYDSADFSVLTPTRLSARVRLIPDPTPPTWELKGVTYHGLAVEERSGGWWARVIFDL